MTPDSLRDQVERTRQARARQTARWAAEGRCEECGAEDDVQARFDYEVDPPAYRYLCAKDRRRREKKP